MLDVIVGDYVPRSGDRVIHTWSPDVIYRSINNTKSLVMFAEELSITKTILEFIKENTQIPVKVVCLDGSLVRGMRSSKKMKITYSEEVQESSPFELAHVILTTQDREYLLGYLLSNKPSLFMPLRSMICAWDKLSEHNKKSLLFLDRYLFKVNYELLAHFCAFSIKSEPYLGKFIRWRFPKKGE